MTDSPEWNMYVDEGARLLRVDLQGRLGIEEWLTVLREVPATQGFRPGLNSVFDVRTGRLDLSSSDVHRLVGLLDRHLERRGGGGFRCAIVVASDIDFGISRMIEMVADQVPFESRVFRSMTDAELWVL